MRAVVFKGKDRLAVVDVPKPRPGAGEALIRVTLTTMCGADVDIVRGEYPVRPGLVLGRETAGVIAELGPGLEHLYAVGDRVIVGAITPCGQCFHCLNGSLSQRGGALGGWKFGNTIDGAWAEYLLVPDAKANLALIPHDLADEDVVLCPDIFSTTSCLGGQERMRRLMAVVAERHIKLSPLLTHHFDLDDIVDAFDLFSNQRDGVLKVGLRPFRPKADRMPHLVGARALDDEC